MTSTPAADAPRSDDVRRALRHLADGSARARSDEYRRCLDDAEAAAADVCDAATFLADGRLPDLARAVGVAADEGETARARRGRESLATLRRLRAAVAGDGGGADDPPPDADHVHRARGTVLGRTGQPHDR